jgi:Mrp family chromosome partitioning ATPase/capsular polysaccharide biosynthesis protein
MARAVERRTSRTVPSLGEYTQAIWRRKPLIATGVLLGLALGAFVLPKVRTSQPIYQATVRLKVVELVSDTIVRERPQFDTGAGSSGGANALQDVDLAARILRRLGGAAAGLAAEDVTTRLNANPVPRSSFVDLTYTDTDRKRAGKVVKAYAKAWASRRNALDDKRLRTAMVGADRQINELQRQLTRLGGVAAPNAVQQAELTRVQTRLDALVKLHDDILRQRLFLGVPTGVLGGPVLSQLSRPTPRALVVVLGLFIGLFAAMGLCLLLEAARPRVLVPADAERAAGIQVIASVPRGGGRGGGLSVVRRPSSPAAEGYRRVAGALERRGLGGDVRMMAVTSADPGEGTSTLAANLAHLLARQGHEVVLVSADLRSPRLDRLVNLEGAPGLAEWLEGGGDTAPPLRPVAERLLALPAGSPSRNPGELLTAGRFRHGLQPLVEAGFIVLVVTPPALWSAEAMTLAAVADATLVVVRARTSRWRAIEQLAEGLRRDGVREIGMVLVGDRRRSTSRFLTRRTSVGHLGRHQSKPPPVQPAWPLPSSSDTTGRAGDASLAHLQRLYTRFEPLKAQTGTEPVVDRQAQPGEGAVRATWTPTAPTMSSTDYLE